MLSTILKVGNKTKQDDIRAQNNNIPPQQHTLAEWLSKTHLSFAALPNDGTGH